MIPFLIQYLFRIQHIFRSMEIEDGSFGFESMHRRRKML